VKNVLVQKMKGLGKRINKQESKFLIGLERSVMVLERACRRGWRIPQNLHIWKPIVYNGIGN